MQSRAFVAVRGGFAGGDNKIIETNQPEACKSVMQGRVYGGGMGARKKG